MAMDHAALLEVLEAMKSAGVDERIRLAATTIYQALIDAELTSVIGAGPWERSPVRTAQRNGYRPRVLSTAAGDLELSIPKLRSGSFFPSLLERRRRVDQALFAVVMEAYLHGVSTRKVDDLVKALGIDSGISKSEVSRICADLDVEVAAFRDRPLTETSYPYVFLDATYCKARVNHRVVSQAVVIATGVTGDGRREVLGFRCRRLRRRRLLDRLLALVEGSRAGRGAAGHLRRPHRPQASRRGGDVWCLGGNNEMVAAAIRTIFAQPDTAHVIEQFETIAAMLGRQLPKVEQMMRDACDDLLAFAAFPQQHWRKIWSTNPLERVNREVKRHTEVVGVFPNPPALLRLAGAVLVEIHNEWAVATERRYLSEGSMKLITQQRHDSDGVAKPAALTA
jgi:putative transposase